VRLLLVADENVEDRVATVRARQGVAQIRLGHCECARLEGTSVKDAGNEPLAAQAPIGSASTLGSFLNLEFYSLGSHGAEV
jgi:hypothetical protein